MENNKNLNLTECFIKNNMFFSKYLMNGTNSKLESLSIINDLRNDTKLYFKKCIPLVNFLETYQGEGPNCGKKMVLTRFKYCNKLCPFCDTQKFTKSINPDFVSLKDIELKLQTSPNLMITGGEPTMMNKVIDKNPFNEDECSLSQFECTVMMASILKYGFLDIETNGLNLLHLCQFCSDLVEYHYRNINISWSPKFISNEDYNTNIYTLELLNNYNYIIKYCNPVIKIVIGDGLDDYKNFIYHAIYHYNFDSNRVYLMPKGTTLEEINDSMKLVMEIASDLKCNISSRLHVIHNFK